MAARATAFRIRYGRWVVRIAAVVFAVSMLICAYSWGFWQGVQEGGRVFSSQGVWEGYAVGYGDGRAAVGPDEVNPWRPITDTDRAIYGASFGPLDRLGWQWWLPLGILRLFDNLADMCRS